MKSKEMDTDGDSPGRPTCLAPSVTGEDRGQYLAEADKDWPD